MLYTLKENKEKIKEMLNEMLDDVESFKPIDDGDYSDRQEFLDEIEKFVKKELNLEVAIIGDGKLVVDIQYKGGEWIESGILRLNLNPAIKKEIKQWRSHHDVAGEKWQKIVKNLLKTFKPIVAMLEKDLR